MAYVRRERDHNIQVSWICCWASCSPAFLCKDSVPQPQPLRDGVHPLPPVSRAHSKRPPQGLLWWSRCYILTPRGPEQPLLQPLESDTPIALRRSETTPGSHCTQTADQMITAHQALFHTEASEKKTRKEKADKASKVSQGNLVKGSPRNSRTPKGQRGKVPKQPASETLLYLDMPPRSQVRASRKDYELLCCGSLSGYLWIPGFLGGAHRSYLLFLLCKNKLCWQVQAQRG